MGVAVVSPLLPLGLRPGPAFVSAANGLGFLQLQVWLGLVTEEVLFRARPYEATGRLARWRHPGPGLLARLADGLANSRLAGALLEPLPEVEMRSDIRDVVYVNYLVPAATLAPLVPEGLELQRVGPDGKYALFTFLTYQHGHFGFAFLGPLRRLLPSPVQTNWRVHVRDPRTGHEGITFVTNAISSAAPALGARLLTEGMPMHVLERAEVTRADDGAITVSLQPGAGSAPDGGGSSLNDFGLPEPLEPTSAPVTISRSFESMKPVAAAAQPEPHHARRLAVAPRARRTSQPPRLSPP